MIRKLVCGAGALGASMFAATAAWAAETAEAVGDAAADAAATVALRGRSDRRGGCAVHADGRNGQQG